jgi:hypothetical protein
LLTLLLLPKIFERYGNTLYLSDVVRDLIRGVGRRGESK